ncbi:hypothetical protein CK203_106566 [Vitis vinifera]|uniref:Uncharacterized protein n=1 Tax=Vitis vinifera TaxID=29760 RepID=A0A438DVX9_VITVI|nr:hypothetical protein CK203_106566 [Vitis vinifera]
MMDSSAFVGNSKLCGEPLKPCADSEGIQRGFELERAGGKDKLKWGLATGYIDVREHSGGDRHIDADWSPIIEDLYSPELEFERFHHRKPLGCRGSACVEVMTTLHGSAPSLRRRAEGCVPPEGMIASARDL